MVLQELVTEAMPSSKKRKMDKVSDAGNASDNEVEEEEADEDERFLNIPLSKIDYGDDKQFGFRANSSCQHAIWCLMGAIRISKNSNYELFLEAIDASKAFDKINLLILYCILISCLHCAFYHKIL